MSYSSDELKSFNTAALKNSQFIASVNGKSLVQKKKFGKLKSLSAIGFILVMVGVFGVVTVLGQTLPALIHDKLAEEFDMQHADMVESMKIIYQQALREGDFDVAAAEKLKEKNVLVGYMENNNFVEATKHSGGLVLKFREKIITADEFIGATKDREFFDALISSSPAFSQAMGYYDESARKVFQKIGTNRNNYTSDSEFNEVVDRRVGQGSDINVNSVSLVQKTRENENGDTEIYYEYEENGAPASSKSAAGEFIDGVRDKNPGANATEGALYTANALAIADAVVTKERSVSLYVIFQENFSKMKAGDGNEAKVPESMNALTDVYCHEVVDTKNAQIIEECGSALEAPGLYAALSGNKIEPEKVENYSSERILKTVENQLGVNDASTAMSETVVSSLKRKGSIGRFIDAGIEKGSEALLKLVEPTVSSSLMDNSYQTIKGVRFGELLKNGAINLGGMLAKKSGGTVGDAQAIMQYAKLNAEIIAMEAAVDRMNRSPFDITSKNTFLGSIIYNLAISLKGINYRTFASSLVGIIYSVKQAAVSLLPKSYADGVSAYLTSFGNCEQYQRIGANGTAECLDNIAFDTSTYNDPFNDVGFVAFVENNTILNNGVRMIRKGSILDGFIKYNIERETPTGVVDGGILAALKNDSASISFIANILSMVKIFLGTSEAEQRVASGAAFVNSSSNPDWQIYKYAQRYVSLARATAALKQYSSGTAYQNLRFFEGEQNPVMALLEEYYAFKDN